MLTFDPEAKYYLGLEPVDMRKSINGLIQVTTEVLSLDPQSGHGFIFVNKRRDKVKLLYWDTQGFALVYKRLERGRFTVPRDELGAHYVLSPAHLQWFLSGIDYQQLAPSLRFSAYA